VPPPPVAAKQREKKSGEYTTTSSSSSGLEKVPLEAETIGMQFEPTADDIRCRGCGFLDLDALAT